MPKVQVPARRGVPALTLDYDISGEGPPVLLMHGFASNRRVNWVAPGWVSFLNAAGRQVIAMDGRGHGLSDKPHETSAYDEGEMAHDIARVLDHAAIPRADYIGYSMGGFIGMRALVECPERLGRVVLAGIGANYTMAGLADPPAIAQGLLARSLDAVMGAVPRQFRQFAEKLGGDLKALAACMMRPRRTVTAEDLRGLRHSVLVITGEKDMISGPPEPLARVIPGAVSAIVPGRDHMTAVGDRNTKEQVLRFLDAG